MLNKIKDDIYVFFKNQMSVKYPDVFGLDENGFSNKIYWRKYRNEEPLKPYIILDVASQGKLNKTHETYKKDGKLYKRENWVMVITFGVYTQSTEGDLATEDRKAIEYIEYIQDLFNSQTTFDTLMKNAIIVDEKEVSNIRDLSSFEETNYSYRYEIDVTFKFDIIKEPESYGLGERVEVNIEIKDSDLTIEIGA